MNDFSIDGKPDVRSIEEVLNDDHNHQNNVHGISIMESHSYTGNGLVLKPYHYQ